MDTYLLLLRGINVGGKHKVVMAQLKEDLIDLGFYQVTTYINSGNVIFQTTLPLDKVYTQLSTYFENTYAFPIPFVIIEKEDYLRQSASLSDTWHQSSYRRDVLFYTPKVNRTELDQYLDQLTLSPDEALHRGEIALFWTKANEDSYLQTTYHKQVAKSPFYKEVTIRNANTFEKLAHLLENF